ncbi:MAG: hypothetical protein ABI467_24325 [Kofleriaceae bacterium]
MTETSAEFRGLVVTGLQGANKRGALACVALAFLAVVADVFQPRAATERWQWHWYTIVIVVVFGLLALVFARSARSVAARPALTELLDQPGSVVRIVTSGNGALRLLMRSSDELRLPPNPRHARLLELLREHSPSADLTAE